MIDSLRTLIIMFVLGSLGARVPPNWVPKLILTSNNESYSSIRVKEHTLELSDRRHEFTTFKDSVTPDKN